MKQIISTEDAPSAVGAYSQASSNGNILFTAGQIPMTSDGELLADKPIDEQTKQCLDNLRGILDSEGLDFDDVLKVTVFLNDIDDFEQMNEIYSGYFESDPPARSAVEVGNLPKSVSIEIEAIVDHT